MDYPGKVITKTQVTPTQTSASGNWTLDDAAAAIKNNNWPVAGVPNPISKSLRFNSADSAYLNRTFGSAPTNDDKATISLWVKRTNPGAENQLYSARASGAAAYTSLRFDSTDELDFLMVNSSGTVIARLVTTAKYRDPSAWYHIVFAYDSTDATSSNRLKLYVNGVQVTVFNTATYPAQNTDLALWAKNTVVNYIGREGDGYSSYLNGYMTEMNFIDGQALTPSDFGLTNPQTGQWIPKKYSGTYGTNGFYLNFKDATSTTTLGYDYSGNANNWTTNNFSVTAGSGNDSLTDVPTPWIVYNTTGDVGGVVRGNYATLNPLGTSNGTLSDGNLRVATNGTTINARGTIALPATGKWYFEFEDVTHLTYDMGFGISNVVTSISSMANANGWWLDVSTTSTYIYSNSTLMNGGSAVFTTGGAGVAGGSGSKWGIAVDIDSGKWWARNSNGWQTISGNTGDPAAGTNPISSDLTGTLFPVIWMNSNSTGGAEVAVINFGQRPFDYTPPSGFLSLCTTNLPASTILDGDQYFNAVLYTGDGTAIGSGGKTITGVGFQSDFTWIKSRSSVLNHRLIDSVRGAPLELQSNLTDAEVNRTEGLNNWTSDGFVVGNASGYNANGTTFVAWNWKANGAGVTNTAGSITSTVSANTTSGFSIVTYTGTGSAATFGHGLGVTPAMYIVKIRNGANNWVVWHNKLANTTTSYILLDSTAAETTSANIWGSTAATSTTIGVGTAAATNANASTYVAYCFAAISGFSAFGSYTGNASTDGPFVYTGFRPRWVLIKCSSSDQAGNGGWRLFDTARGTYNVIGPALYPNESAAEVDSTWIDILSNGFKIRTTSTSMNGSGATYIYAAFAENPFKNALAR